MKPALTPARFRALPGLLGWGLVLNLILSRPLNVYFDLNLLSASFHLLDGNLGRLAA